MSLEVYSKQVPRSSRSCNGLFSCFRQDGLTGSAWGDWANYTASPLRAFENELGVQAPTGFWDPAGFTADGSVENFKRRRQTELKHGRISMLATMGYITPETWIALNVFFVYIYTNSHTVYMFKFILVFSYSYVDGMYHIVRWYVYLDVCIT